MSAQLTALEIEPADGSVRKLVVRRHGRADLARNPDVAAAEFRLLRLLRSMRLPTPTAVHLDESGELLPTPYIVVDYIEGEPGTAPADLPNVLRQLATILVKIHGVDCSSADLSFLPRQEALVADRLRSVHRGRVRAALESVWPLPRRNDDVLLHGDFWPGNTLWRDGKLVAVVDWEDASVGDPLADVANGRLEVLWAFGVDAMNDFTRHWERAMSEVDPTDLPYWDLCADVRLTPRISEWGLDAATEATLRERRRFFVAQALEQLGAGTDLG